MIFSEDTRANNSRKQQTLSLSINDLQAEENELWSKRTRKKTILFFLVNQLGPKDHQKMISLKFPLLLAEAVCFKSLFVYIS